MNSIGDLQSSVKSETHQALYCGFCRNIKVLESGALIGRPKVRPLSQIKTAQGPFQIRELKGKPGLGQPLGQNLLPL